MPDAYSIRESLQGALQDFIRDSGIECVHLEGLIREVVSLLASYREEDLPLFPQVFVFASPDGLKALAPSSTQITIGTATLLAESAGIIVKSCAPLARAGWSIYVVKENGQLQYGVFRSLRHSLSTPAEESMCDLSRDIPIIMIRNRGHLVVDLRSSINNRYTVALTTTPGAGSTLEKEIEKFVNAAATGMKEPLAFKPYLRRLMAEILQDCHGTLLGVACPPKPGKRHTILEDATWLQSPISLSELHKIASANPTADALADLHATEVLLRGMVSSDGVVLFGNDGSILAYRAFLKPKRGEKSKLSEDGGGRRRAYELMKLRLKRPFTAVLFRSQDGDTRCEVSNDR